MATIPQVGGELGNYRIERLLEVGGMSLVYLAEHVGLGRKVALKVLAPELAADDRFRERFIRESRVAVSIDHANIVPIYDAGEIDGVLYMAMLYVEGITLKDLIQETGPMDPEQALGLLEPVGAALDAAHARGLVHRDVKPGNVLLTVGPDGVVGHVYLSDFGLTKRTESRSGLTQTGQFAGTVDYIAPEQIRGGQADGRADLYSFACVAHECLTGKPPYEADNHVAILWSHLQDPPPRITSVRPDLPAPVDSVMARAMAKEPDDRHRSASEFVEALRGALSVEPGLAPRPKAQPTVLRSRPEGTAAAPSAAAPPSPDRRATPPPPSVEERPPEPAPGVAAASESASAPPSAPAAPPPPAPAHAAAEAVAPPGARAEPRSQEPTARRPPASARRLIAIGVAVIVVGALAAGSYVLGRNSADTASAARSPAASAREVPAAAGERCTDIVGERVLVGGKNVTEGTVTCLVAKHVPATIREHCTILSGKTDSDQLPLVGAAAQPPVADVFLLCDGVPYLGNTFTVWYMFKHDRDEVGLDYKQVLASNGITVDQNNDADHCASVTPIERRWWVEAGSVTAAATNIVHTFDVHAAIPFSKFYPVSGRFVCLQEGADEWIAWTDANLTVFGVARNSGGNWDKFQSWWSLEAGPGHPPGV